MNFSLSILIVILFLLFTEGFFSGSELALLSCDRLKLKKRAKLGHLGSILAMKLQESPELILSTTLLMTSTCVMGITVLFTLEARRVFGSHGQWIAILVSSFLVIFFGELLPKYIFRKNANWIAPVCSVPITYLQKALYPLIQGVSLYTRQIERIVRPMDALWGGKKSARDELQGLLSPDAKDTEFSPQEKRMIKRILRFRDTRAKDAALPLVQVDAIEKHSTVAETIEEFDRHRHSRMPVYDERVDNIVGIVELSALLHAADLLSPIEKFVKKAHYAADSQKISDVLADLIESDERMSIVVDEYGGALGILTREDIVEQIVGDLQDEDDPEAHDYRPAGDNRWIVKASSQINHLNEALKLDIPEGDYDTLAGFLLRQLGRIPESGEETEQFTRAGRIHFQVRSASAKKIESVVISRFPVEQEPSNS